MRAGMHAPWACHVAHAALLEANDSHAAPPSQSKPRSIHAYTGVFAVVLARCLHGLSMHLSFTGVPHAPTLLDDSNWVRGLQVQVLPHLLVNVV